MKSSAVLLTLFMLSAFTALGQRDQVSLSLGPALPVGEFGNQDGRGAQSGLAQVGGMLDLTFEHTLRSPTTESWAAVAALVGVYHWSGLGGKLQAAEKISISCAEAINTGYLIASTPKGLCYNPYRLIRGQHILSIDPEVLLAGESGLLVPEADVQKCH